MSPTEARLLDTYNTPIIRVARICDEYLGVGYAQACELAALNHLPFPVYRLWNSNKAPLLVGSKDLADFIDRAGDAARTQWSPPQP